MSHAIADTLVTIGVDMRTVTTLGDLQSGMEEAERLLGADGAPPAAGPDGDVAAPSLAARARPPRRSP